MNSQTDHDSALKDSSKFKSDIERPNFVLILADDLGFADLGLNGSKQIRTPNIGQLAKNGVNFTNAYVSSAVCSPSRAGLLTGVNQVEFGYDNNLPSKTVEGLDPNYQGLPLTEKTIATRLRALGYTTGLVGKWHLGYQKKYHPTNHGFDEYWGYVAGGHDYFASKVGSSGYLAPLESNYKTPEKITYLTDDKGNECVDFITRNKNKPFFLFASFNAPHTPLQALEEDLELYKNIEDPSRRTYAAMVHRLDVNIGKIVKTLKENNLFENTLVVFLSDNGGPVDSNFSCNAPLNGQKGILLEGGIHVPFIMSWPKKLPKTKNYGPMVSSLDIAPTFFELAGGSIDGKKFSGVNLIPFVIRHKTGAPHNNLKWKFTISRAIREGNWKLVSIPDRLPMLYDLASDISEQNDVSLKYINKTSYLLDKLGKWDISLPHPLILEGAQWKSRQLKLYDKKYPLTQPINATEKKLELIHLNQRKAL
ncbi:sulfatase-like hydrolase/transferase [Maribacter algicola]|uniref:Sulfatase-like hydrolase/transferase n=1 Tax=Meishania litoralis TaxID=3434685 RepID=A0ACC7LKT9_9FLAO